MSNWRRFEVLLPLRFNDGRDIPDGWIGQAELELLTSFGATTFETQRIEGHWMHSGELYRDALAKIVVDVDDTSQSRQWVKEFKERWKVRLEQIELWVVSFPIEVE